MQEGSRGAGHAARIRLRGPVTAKRLLLLAGHGTLVTMTPMSTLSDLIRERHS